MVKYAILIGINYTGSNSQLDGCQRDIKIIMEYLSFLGYNCTLLLDENSPEHIQPTHNNILEIIKNTIAVLKSSDTLYVHYSGHGTQCKDTNGDEPDGLDECIVPVDYKTSGFITDDVLNDLLVKKLPADAKLRVVFDCCHSGSCLDLPYRWTPNGQKWYVEAISKQYKDIIFISGCTDEQYSADSVFEGKPNGALTYAMMKCLNDIRKSGKYATTYRWKDLLVMIYMRLRKSGFEQIPQISVTDKKTLSKFVDLI